MSDVQREDVQGRWTFSGTLHTEWVAKAYYAPDGTVTGKWVAEDDRFPGAWADGDTEDGAIDHLCVVIQDWWYLKARDGDDDLPPCQVTHSGRHLEGEG